jgi:hypothetical protein
LQAVEAIKLVLQQGDVLYGRLLVYDALAATFRELKIRANPDCQWCAEGRPFPGYIDYAGFCGVPAASIAGAKDRSHGATTG